LSGSFLLISIFFVELLDAAYASCFAAFQMQRPKVRHIDFRACVVIRTPSIACSNVIWPSSTLSISCSECHLAFQGFFHVGRLWGTMEKECENENRHTAFPAPGSSTASQAVTDQSNPSQLGLRGGIMRVFAISGSTGVKSSSSSSSSSSPSSSSSSSNLQRSMSSAALDSSPDPATFFARDTSAPAANSKGIKVLGMRGANQWFPNQMPYNNKMPTFY